MNLLRFRLPDIGEGVAEAEIVAWLVEPGDEVDEDQPVVEVMTDKATVTIGAPESGRIAELRYQVGQAAKVGEVIFCIETGAAGGAAEEPAAIRGIGSRATLQSDAPPAPEPQPAEALRSEAAASAVGDIRESLPGTSWTAAAEAAAPDNRVSILAAPAVRQLARDLGVPLEALAAEGRVTKAAVLRAALAKEALRGDEQAEAEPPTVGPAVQSERVPFVGLRRTIAQRMKASLARAAHATFVDECRADALYALRARLNEEGQAITFLPLIAKCVIEALKTHRSLNASLDEGSGELVLHGAVHLGVATATPGGLMVPVVKDADRMSILELAEAIGDLSVRARKGALVPQELSGSTFTITSLGRYGGLMATPILNPPEVGILGIHRMRETAVVDQGALAVGRLLPLSLSFDHCVVDGLDAARFVHDIIQLLQAPEQLLVKLR